MKNTMKIKVMSAVIALCGASASFAQDAAYPVAVLDRPGSLPIGAVEGAVDFNSEQFDMDKSKVSAKAKFGLGMGTQLTLGYDGVTVKTGKFDDTASVGFRAKLFSVGNYGTSANVNLPVHFNNSIIENVEFGFSNSYAFNNQFVVSALGRNFLDVKFVDKDTKARKLDLEVNVPVVLMFQANENIYLELDTSLANIHTKFSDSKFIWKKFPVELGVTYAFNNAIDVSVKGGFENALIPTKTFTAGLGVAFRTGNIG